MGSNQHRCISKWISSCLAATVCGTAWAAPSTSTTTSEDTGLEEIIVTAERFNSTIQSTPISISALSGDQLTAAGVSRVQDLARDVPGLSMRYASAGLTEYEARGLASNGGAAPTVGFYLDEIPLSPPAVSQSGKVVIDPNLYDIERVEILRGPQGTLYGSGSMGGTIKVLTNQPKLGTFEGSVQGTGSYTDGGIDQRGHGSRGNHRHGGKIHLDHSEHSHQHLGALRRTTGRGRPDANRGYRARGTRPFHALCERGLDRV